MGLLSSTRCKHKLRISPDQQGRCWCSFCSECLFMKGLQATMLFTVPAHTGLHWSHSTKNQSLRLGPLSWITVPNASLLLARKQCGVWTTHFLLFLPLNFPDKHISSSLQFVFLRNPLWLLYKCTRLRITI